MNKNFADFGKSVLLGMEEFIPKVNLLKVESADTVEYGPDVYAPFEFAPIKVGGGDGAYARFVGFLVMEGTSAGSGKTPREILGEKIGVQMYVRGGIVSIVTMSWRDDYSFGIQLLPGGDYEPKYCTLNKILDVNGVIRWKNPIFE